MATTKIPSQASVRRALTTLKRFGIVRGTTPDMGTGLTYMSLEIPNELMSPKKTSRKKPKHKKVEPTKILEPESDKMSEKNSFSFDHFEK